MVTPPSAITLNTHKNRLTLRFDDIDYQLSAEFLRVYSPSAEVVGHGPGQEVLQIDKEQVTITDIKPVGNYAVKLVFSDGHDSGIYSWAHLHHLCCNQSELWQQYLARLTESGHPHSELT